MGHELEAIKRVHNQAVLDAHAAFLRGEGYTFQEIADEMGCSVSNAHARVMRAYSRMPGPTVTEERQRMLQELEDAAVAVYAVLERQHVSIGQSGVISIKVLDADGIEHKVPVPDDHPVLEAVDRLLKIQERRARLLGVDAPSRSTHTVITEDAVDAEIRRLEAELGDRADRGATREAPLLEGAATAEG